jgi:hypothetical protein
MEGSAPVSAVTEALFVFGSQEQKPRKPLVSWLKTSNGSLNLNKVRTEEFNCPFVIQISEI